MKKEIILKPIGVIRTPFKEPKGIPIQGKFGKGAIGQAELFPGYEEGLADLEGFSHIILVYYFSKSKGEGLTGRPFLEDEEHGIFAIRSPHRPNHIGISVVKLEGVKGNIVTFREVDMLDGTPLLDIKPYISYFDSREDVRNGWLEKHFKNGKMPKRTIRP